MAMERSWDVEDSLLAEVPANSDVIVETSGISPPARALQVEFPLLSFLQPVRDNPRLLQWFHGASTGDDFDLLASALPRTVYYLTTSDLRCETGILPARFLKRQGGFELYIVGQESSDAMLHFLDEYFVNSYNP